MDRKVPVGQKSTKALGSVNCKGMILKRTVYNCPYIFCTSLAHLRAVATTLRPGQVAGFASLRAAAAPWQHSFSILQPLSCPPHNSGGAPKAHSWVPQGILKELPSQDVMDEIFRFCTSLFKPEKWRPTSNAYPMLLRDKPFFQSHSDHCGIGNSGKWLCPDFMKVFKH